MRLVSICFLMIVILLSTSCTKNPNPVSPPPVHENKILLKDIVLSNLPSPYYHFEYRTDSVATKASFASDLNMYDIVYDGSRIAEMRSNTFTNKDTLRYQYDNYGKVTLIRFIDKSGVTYRRIFFSYNASQLTSIEWEHKENNTGFLSDRTLSFSYYADGNLKEAREHRPARGTQQEANYTTLYEQYDDKTNVDDFMLMHDSFNDHLFLLSGIHLQKNNPRKETRSGNGVNYTAAYTYNYRTDGTPSEKSGTVLFSTGQQAGQTFHPNVSYSYY
jgi:hypothetical protein